MKTREQAIFDEIFKRVLSLGYAVYDYKPDEKTSYPFVELEDTTTYHATNKTDVKGSVELTLSVWGAQKKRRQVSDMCSAIFAQAMTAIEAGGYPIALSTGQSSISLIDDMTTLVPLKRGRVRLVFTLL
ncbi:Phage capsid and scaffold [Streptococcus sp. DD10]|uniref:phage capsid protein n=1 Tax=Streptococcus sp. DD10 TaxID=1777878 RepID=UPI000791D766|nr:phage capsid protein [Streptococcus sp. DD10]KXT74893.1 Phage capsid and scaffold [Streptococcus sp. DD10]